MERVLADLVNRLDQRRFESHVMALQYVGRFGRDLESAATVHLGPRQERASLLWPRRLAEAIRRLAPDVVHTHSGVWYKAAKAARAAGVARLVHTEHGRHVPDPWISRRLDRVASRRTDVVVAVSEKTATLLVRAVGVDRDRVRVVRNGIEAKRVASAGTRALRRSFSIASDARIVASVGRLEPVKGYDLLIDAFARLALVDSGESPPVLIVAGDGSQRSALEARAFDSGIADQIRFVGWLDDVASLLEEASVFALGSHSEGTSISLLEAMAAGCCPVVTDVGGNADVLGAGLAHRLVPPSDADALSTALSRALEGAEERRADGETARERVRREFDLGTMVEQYSAIYEDREA
ncbi:MAG: glycosyltransferase [Gemmatimonadota bacterium]